MEAIVDSTKEVTRARNGGVARACGAHKHQKKSCKLDECIFAPHFPPADKDAVNKFDMIFKVFGGLKHIENWLIQQNIPEAQRTRAVERYGNCGVCQYFMQSASLSASSGLSRGRESQRGELEGSSGDEEEMM